MQSTAIDQFITDMQGDPTLYDFHSEITADLLSKILGQIESMMENEEDVKKSRKVYNILVEALQNLYHHTDAQAEGLLDNGDQKKTVRFLMVRKNEEYNILVANYIVKESVPALKAKLDKINSLDKEGLREYYKEVLDNGQYSIHGGGGLGMIDIARKSGNPLEYSFTGVNADYDVFTLRIKV